MSTVNVAERSVLFPAASSRHEAARWKSSAPTKDGVVAEYVLFVVIALKAVLQSEAPQFVHVIVPDAFVNPTLQPTAVQFWYWLDPP